MKIDDFHDQARLRQSYGESEREQRKVQENIFSWKMFFSLNKLEKLCTLFLIQCRVWEASESIQNPEFHVFYHKINGNHDFSWKLVIFMTNLNSSIAVEQRKIQKKYFA